jgi:hypothetical protein
MHETTTHELWSLPTAPTEQQVLGLDVLTIGVRVHPSEHSAERTSRPLEGGNTTSGLAAALVTTADIVSRPALSDTQDKYQVLQQWEGLVTSVRKCEFSADLLDQTDRSRPREEAVFGIDELDPADAKLLREGAVFYWVIAYETRHGTRRRVAELRFRRLPTWTQTELKDVAREASERFRRLGYGAHTRE